MNRPAAVALFVSVAAVLIVGSVIAAEIFASMTADKLAQVADDDLMDLADSLEQSPCDDPGAHSLTGCPRCINVIAAICAFDFDRSLDALRRTEEQR